MALSPARKAIIALILANIFWGAGGPIFKLSLQNIPLMTLAFWRFILAVPFLLILARMENKPVRIEKKDRPVVFLYAVFGITVNIIFFFLGIRLTNSMNTAVIMSGSPVITYLLAYIFLHEAFVPRKLSGMLIGMAGMLTIIFEPLISNQSTGSMLGNVLLVIAALGAIIQTIIGRRILPRYNTFAFTAACFLIGAATFLPLMLYEYATTPGLYLSLDWRGYIGILYGTFFSGICGYGLFDWGLARIKASDASVFAFLEPVAATVLGVFLVSERITHGFVFGAILIFIGIMLAEGRIRFHPTAIIVNHQTSKSRRNLL
ncbi:hypothetical protein A2Z33_01360 [Candidatus Gottesmanbacteria bacterium RBG_16_52_11]|uniref:EamA domain-containing protein n=1 Tax=Candidatus Gottesmanbacteria bacterium RBG_16_52_11 TaxID=1798374 RepID=A0A1F5YNT4_9BACT|nr:MAG: hypothetical protein A2Z33_01360 [Candidatus Gottesmanbacteria bacterium RBG_16_52_11]